MRFLFKGAGLLIAVISVIWLALLWHWRNTAHDISATDIVVYLGLLPLVVFGLLLALRWAVRSALAGQAAADAARAQTTGAAAPPAAAAASHGGWLALGAWVKLPGGEDAAAVLEACVKSEPLPQPHEDLRDADGLPVICASVTELDTEALPAQLDAAVQALAGHVEPPEEWPQDLLRALAALVPVLDEVAAALAAQAHAFQFNASLEDALTAPASASPASLRRVRVLTAWPEPWPESLQAVATQWLHTALMRTGEGVLMPEQWAMQAMPLTGVELLLGADKLLQALADQQQPDAVLVLSCHSDLSEGAVDRLAQAGRLYSAKHAPRGAIPGEGAAALLLASESWPMPDDTPTPLWRLMRPVGLRRETATADEGGKSSSKTTASAKTQQEAVAQMLATARLQANDVVAVLADADQHSALATELFAVTLPTFPELIPQEDMRLLGKITGDLGRCSTLATVALAVQLATDDSAKLPIMALSLSDPIWRMAVLLQLRPSV